LTRAPSKAGYERILLAYDGSKNSQSALSKAAALAESCGARLTIVVVVPPSAYEETMRSGREVLAKAVEKAKPTVSDVRGVLRDGQAADEILSAADEQGADLVVIGRRGLSGVQRFLMGGTSSAVVAHSKCDVLVVK
jgi:nucleotide-binding universal stress UspA family protein